MDSSGKEGEGRWPKRDSSSSNGDSDITEPAPSSPRLWLQLLWLAVESGLNPPQVFPPSPSDSLLGGSTHFFQQETEAHGEEEVGRGGCRRGREMAQMKAEVRCE